MLDGKDDEWSTNGSQTIAESRGPIREVLYDDERDWRSKIVKTLRTSYARADAFVFA